MIVLPATPTDIEEVKRERRSFPHRSRANAREHAADVTEARVYRLRSGFVNNSVFVTLATFGGWTQTGRIEIFINSKEFDPCGGVCRADAPHLCNLPEIDRPDFSYWKRWWHL